MGLLADRVGEGLEGIAQREDDKGKTLKDRLKGWLADVLSFGIDVFMSVLAKSYSKRLTPLIATIEKTGKVPPELAPLLEEVKSPTGEAAGLIADRMSGAMVGGAIGMLIDAFLLPIAYAVNTAFPSKGADPAQLTGQWLRKTINDSEYIRQMKMHGYDEPVSKTWMELSEVLFPSDVVSQIWLRDKGKYTTLWQDVAKLGISGDKIEILKELAYKIPGVQDVIRYAVREAYSPEIYKKFGQDAEFPTEALPDAEKAGVKQDHLLKEWIAHWELPGVTQGYDMLHRGEIDLDTLNLLLRARDVMPWWRDKLIALSWDLPNRIELRMMARYGLVDKPYIMRLLEKIGLDEEYRSDIADMNIAVGILTDLRSRYRNLYITADDIKKELAASALSPRVQNRLYEYIVKVEKPERIAETKKLTTAEVVKGVKKGILIWEEAVERLKAMNYEEDEAILKLAIELEVAAGSPENPGDFKRLTDLYRMAAGLPTDRSKEEIITSEKAVAAKYPITGKLSEEELKTKIDTTRRKRRLGEITRDEEVTELLKIGVDISLATAYTENDDLRLRKGVGE